MFVSFEETGIRRTIFIFLLRGGGDPKKGWHKKVGSGNRVRKTFPDSLPLGYHSTFTSHPFGRKPTNSQTTRNSKKMYLRHTLLNSLRGETVRKICLNKDPLATSRSHSSLAMLAFWNLGRLVVIVFLILVFLVFLLRNHVFDILQGGSQIWLTSSPSVH